MDGKKEVSLDQTPGVPAAAPTSGKLGMGKQLNIRDMLEDRSKSEQKAGPRRQLSPQVQAGLTAMAAEQERRKEAQEESHAEAAVQTPDAPKPQSVIPPAEAPTPGAEPEQKFEPAPVPSDELDLTGIQQNPYDDPKKRAEVEKRCKDMSFDSVLISREVRQVVPMRTGFEVEFRAHAEHEEKYVRKILFAANNEGMSQQQFWALTTICLLVLNVVSINGDALPSHITSEGLIDPKGFEKKQAWLEKFPSQVIGFLGANNSWFEDRFRKLVTEDNIKNG